MWSCSVSSTYDDRKIPRYRSLRLQGRRRLALLAQAHDHVDARDLVAIRHVGHLREHQMRIGNIDQLVVVLEIEVMMGRHVGVEIGLGAVDRDLTQETS